MKREAGLRERKKVQTRQRIADVAAGLFATRGHDDVTMLDVARAAEVSDQTVYNYLAAKQDLVLDRAERFRTAYREAVEQRDAGSSPAAALLPLARADVERYRTADLDVARGEFMAQSVESAVLRRFTPRGEGAPGPGHHRGDPRDAPGLPRIVAHAHASSIVAVIQALYDEIGTSILHRTRQRRVAAALHETVDVAFTSLDRTFAQLVAGAHASAT